MTELAAAVASPWVEGGESRGEPWTVESVGDVVGFEALRPQWEELLAASPADCLFLTWEWLYTWWKHLGGGRRLSILAVRSGGRLAALAPLSLPAPRLPQAFQPQAFRLLGTGQVGSDYLDLIVRRGEEGPAAEALAAYFARQRTVVELGQLHRGLSAAEAVSERLARQGWRSLVRVTHVCPYIEVGGRSWEGYLTGLGASHRSNLRRRLRKLEERFEVRFERVTGEVQLAEAFELLVTLHHGRWRHRGGSDAFADPALVEFHREMTRLALARGWLRLFVLRLDGRPAAALYGFYYRRRFLYYQSGFDAAYAPWGVGLVTLGMSIRAALEEGATEIDLLHGGEGYKFLWTSHTRELARLELYPPSLGGRLRRQARRTVRDAKDRVRCWLGRERTWPLREPPAGHPVGGGRGGER